MWVSVTRTLALALITFALVGLPSKAISDPVGCTECDEPALCYNCDDEGFAYQACMDMATYSMAVDPNGYTYKCDWRFGNTWDCHKLGTYIIGCPENQWGDPSHRQFITSTMCVARNPGQQFYDVAEPTTECIDGCEMEATTCSCNGDVTLCLCNVEPNGNYCYPEDDPGYQQPSDDVPENCVRNDETGQVSCDCSVTPEAAYCQVPDPDNPPDPLPDGCTIDANGNVICVEGNPPPDPPPDPPPPQDGGGPGEDGQPGGDDPAPGESCVPGDPNCYNPGGGICEEGDTDCTVSDSPAGGEGEIETCDPATQNCEGQGSAQSTGQCDAPPVCDGDAIQCAILTQQWRNYCNMIDLKGEKPPWEEDADYGRDLADEATDIDISNQIDQTGFAGGSCPADINVTAFGSSFNIEFGPICDIAAVVRVFVILISLLWAGPYIVRSF